MEPERISFPADYPIKVLARSAGDLRVRLDAVFCRHFGTLPPDCVTARNSAQSNFIALTYVVRVEAETQLAALHAELQAMEEIVMVL